MVPVQSEGATHVSILKQSARTLELKQWRQTYITVNLKMFAYPANQYIENNFLRTLLKHFLNAYDLMIVSLEKVMRLQFPQN